MEHSTFIFDIFFIPLKATGRCFNVLIGEFTRVVELLVSWLVKKCI